ESHAPEDARLEPRVAASVQLDWQVAGNPVLTACVAAVACLGLFGRILLLLLSGNQPVGRLSGTGDQIRYQDLADSIFRGNGFTYAGQPTALRPPLYPILLAAMRVLF